MQHAPITTPITDKLASMTWIRWFRQLVDRVEEIKGTVTPAAMALNDLTDVDTASNAEGDLLRRGADGIWYPAHVTISEDAPTGTPGTLDWIWFVVDPL